MKSETVATLAVCTQHDAKSATSEVAHDHSSDGHVHRILRTVSCEDHDWQTTEPAVVFTCTSSFPQRHRAARLHGAPQIAKFIRVERTPPRHPVARRCVSRQQHRGAPSRGSDTRTPRHHHDDTQSPGGEGVSYHHLCCTGGRGESPPSFQRVEYQEHHDTQSAGDVSR